MKIRYSIMAKIHNMDKTFIRYKNLLMVHEPPVAFQANTVNKMDKPVNVWGCCDKGSVGV